MDFKKSINMSLTDVYDRHSDMLFRIALTHTSCREDAEDACQDVFIKFSQLNKSFIDDEHIKSWLIRTCINRCHDISRYHKIRNHLDIDDIRDIIADDDMAKEYLSLNEALRELPSKYKDIIILHYYEGYSLEECSRLLKISLSNSKMRLMRAREMMKIKIEKEDR
ncbi:MAG: RNA polymerase sigma factor [Clostridia bacterium]|nr:RNA polymerase sigma factor [Clostridia bacterium]